MQRHFTAVAPAIFIASLFGAVSTLGADTYYNSDTTLDGTTSGNTSTTCLVGYEYSDVDLSLINGASLTSAYFIIGSSGTPSNAANNTVTVDASSLVANYWLVVGEYGEYNTLTIQNGATLTTNYTSLSGDDSFIGEGCSTSTAWSTNTDGSYGYGNTVTVTGKGSSWTMEDSVSDGMANYLYVGYAGCSNKLKILNGGAVKLDYVIVGYGSEYGSGVCGHGNSITVDGSEDGTSSSLTVNGSILLGYAGSDNFLVVSNGGTVSADQIIIGCGQCSGGLYSSNDDDSYGYGDSMTVTGKGSSVTVADTMYVGCYGFHNTMNISDGGTVYCKNSLMIGSGDASYDTGGYNTVTVSGSGSKLTMGYNLFIGMRGDYNSLIKLCASSSAKRKKLW